MANKRSHGLKPECFSLSVALDTLKNCSETIKKKCEKSLPTGLEANIKKCNKLAEEFR